MFISTTHGMEQKKIILATSCRTSVGKYTKPSAVSSEAIIILNKQAMFISTAKDVQQKEVHQPLKLMQNKPTSSMAETWKSLQTCNSKVFLLKLTF